MTELPIDIVLPDLAAALRGRPAALLRAPTGAGKTTRVPPALLDAGLAGAGQIVMLEPRRLAARAAARRLAAERGSRLGAEIGYHVRFDRCCGPQTRILVVTPGILLRMLHDDPCLEAVTVLIFDEFHERGLDADLVLGMARLLQSTVRPELRLLLMSATLAVERMAAYLDDCPVVVSAGRQHPVDIHYEPKAQQEPWPLAAAHAVERWLERTSDGLLVFLPGLPEIRQTARHLETLKDRYDFALLPLHGDLPPEQQDLALAPGTRRKVVLATNVAETSVTVEGITAVIDTGLARVMQFDGGVGLDRLRLTPIARSAAEQRAGRAGRTGPGICVRLWSEAAHRARPEDLEPEIRRVDLVGAMLQLLALGETDILHFPWLEPPRAEAVAQALALLRRLDAVADGGITDLGRTLARLPVQPRLGRLLVEGHRHGVAERATLAAALLAERDPVARSLEGPAAARHTSLSDVLDRVEALEAFAATGNDPTGTLHRQSAKYVLRAQQQLARTLLHEMRGQTQAAPTDATEAFLRSLLAAFPDRVARRRRPGSRRGVMVGGRGVRLAPTSAVSEPELFLSIDIDAGKEEALVRQASALRRDWLPADRVHAVVEVAFDTAEEKVVARRRLCYEDLVLEETPAALPDDDTVVRALVAAAAERLERVLPAADSPGGLYLTRLRCLRAWMPELDLPAFTDPEMRELLTWLVPRCRSFADLRGADWPAALQGKLSHAQRQAVDREAPERLTVPSGSRIVLQYELGRPPVLAVRIQELFGLAETPRVAAGRVPVLLHLLAPNYRPQQVTDDLASFWHNTYTQVRKELRARYPRHAWPEDPWSAPAQSRPQRRR